MKPRQHELMTRQAAPARAGPRPPTRPAVPAPPLIRADRDTQSTSCASTGRALALRHIGEHVPHFWNVPILFQTMPEYPNALRRPLACYIG